MRKTILINENWKYIKEDVGIMRSSLEEGQQISLPHTWNNIDGQDGGNDYYRGRCWYEKKLDKLDVEKDEEVWIEFRGVAVMADVYVNGKLAGHHEGGYSTFRVNITPFLEEENTVVVSADNRAVRTVYPQRADFTFYGGIYRDVYLITAQKSHFALDYFGGSGVKITPQIEGKDAQVKVETWTQNTADGSQVTITIQDAEGSLVGTATCSVLEGKAEGTIKIEDVHLWNGLEDPYQYTLKAELESGDQVESKFGCRTFKINPKKGFFLNGKSYPLCGAARHQDRQGVGNALTPEMHEEDIEIMLEMGANTIRAAHYQHDQYFFDLADQHGFIVWAEIPYITEHMPEARENTISQMTELVVQNYNHPSIVCWALSNEITVTTGVTDDLVENHHVLNDLCHQLDSTRPTAMANAFMLETDSHVVNIPDIRSYNLYYGWYLGEKEDNDSWFDTFHEKYPNTVVGLGEYGADANPQYHSINPERGDYTESYQAVYHEHMLQMWEKRPYIWAMHVWNMFDFGADGREEGGKPGQNQKGLVTFDRKIKKDAFYIYKAYLSKEPFVHLCGRRNVDRTEEETEIKVYSNQSSVTLFVNGQEVETKSGDKVFIFKIKNSGEQTIEARSGDLSDRMIIRYVEEQNQDYICAGREVINWFDRPDMEIKEGYFSIMDSLNDLNANPEAAVLVGAIMKKASESFGEVAKNVKMPTEMREKMNQASLESMLKQVGKAITPEMVAELNQALGKIKKD